MRIAAERHAVPMAAHAPRIIAGSAGTRSIPPKGPVDGATRCMGDHASSHST